MAIALAAASICWDRRENSRRCASVMPTTAKYPLPSTTVEIPSSRTRRSRHSACAIAPAAAA